MRGTFNCIAERDAALPLDKKRKRQPSLSITVLYGPRTVFFTGAQTEHLGTALKLFCFHAFGALHFLKFKKEQFRQGVLKEFGEER
jgi:hypothetical protein